MDTTQPHIHDPSAPGIGSSHIHGGTVAGDPSGPGIPPFVPPPTMHLDGQAAGTEGIEKGPAGLLGVIFFVIFGVIMVFMVVGAGIPDGGIVGLFVLAIIAMIIYAIARYALSSASPPPSPAEPQYPTVTREVRVETVREMVKVRCRYCGTLNLETDTKCTSCGGNL